MWEMFQWIDSIGAEYKGRKQMRVIKVADIISVLEDHFNTSKVASIMLDLLDYIIEVEDIENWNFLKFLI